MIRGVVSQVSPLAYVQFENLETTKQGYIVYHFAEKKQLRTLFSLF